MTTTYILLIGVFCISCNEIKSDKTDQQKEKTEATTTPKVSSIPGDSLAWITNFKVFRTAVYQADRSKVKSFVDFPILNQSNDIWYLAYEGNDEGFNLLSDKPKPFTDVDFDKYYTKIFPKLFINSILKIKTEELFEKGTFETVELKDGNTTCTTHATFDKEKNTLTLSLAYNTPVKAIDGDGKVIEDPGEYNVSYFFDILNTGQIKFRQIRMIG